MFGTSNAGRLLSLPALVATFVAGCAGASSQEDPFRGQGSTGGGPDSLYVTIDNQTYNEATVYALWDGRVRERMGEIPATASRTFGLEYESDAIRFEVDFLAGGEFIGEQILVGPGDHVGLTIPPGGG